MKETTTSIWVCSGICQNLTYLIGRKKLKVNKKKTKEREREREREREKSTYS